MSLQQVLRSACSCVGAAGKGLEPSPDFEWPGPWQGLKGSPRTGIFELRCTASFPCEPPQSLATGGAGKALSGPSGKWQAESLLAADSPAAAVMRPPGQHLRLPLLQALINERPYRLRANQGASTRKPRCV
jgi:hypothetical protein